MANDTHDNAACRHRGVTMASLGTMAPSSARKRPTHTYGGGVRRTEPTAIVHVKGVSIDLQRRIRVASAEEGTTYAGLFELLLNMRDDRRSRQLAQQASPLHRPRVSTDLDGEPVTM